MTRIAIIDHDEHRLYVEDIPEDILEKQYGGDEQKYIDDNYDIENYSWDYITEGLFLPAGESDFCDIDFDTILD
jgi:hypothetical protein